MIRKKLTASLKQKIKDNPRAFKKSELSGDALHYLNRVRGAAKARKIKKDTTVIINGVKLPKDTQAYELIEALAADKNMSPARFVKKFPDATTKYIKADKFYFKRDVEKLKKHIDELPSYKKIYIESKDGLIKVKKELAKYYLTRLRNKMINTAEIYDIIIIEYFFDAKGGMHIPIPFPKEYNDLNDHDEILFFIDSNYPNIFYYLGKN